MFFELTLCWDGFSDRLGLVVADTPEKAAEKLGRKIQGFLTQGGPDGLRAHYLEPAPNDEGTYILEEVKELSSIPIYFHKKRRAS